MYEQRKQLLKLLKTFSDNGLSEHLVLIGSWAEYMYMETDILPGYEANIRTLDVDFLVKNLRRPNPPVNIVGIAKEEGFFVEEDCLTGVTRFLSADGFEIEFLIAQKGKGDSSALKTNLGITAQALRHLSLLSNNIVTVDHLGIKINIPEPEAFVLHKMIINSERKEKMEKDQIVINKIYPHLDKDKFKSIYQSLAKKECKAVDQYIEKFIIPVIERENEINKAKALLK